MGCDIHIVLEKKVGEKWIGLRELSTERLFHYSEERGWTVDYYWHPAGNRNYDRFAKLAGVRGDGPVAKGRPDDISDLAGYLFDKWDGDGHSHSWTLLDEAVQIFLETERAAMQAMLKQEADPRLKNPHLYFFGLEEEDIDPGIEGEPKPEYRIVYCFDN